MSKYSPLPHELIYERDAVPPLAVNNGATGAGENGGPDVAQKAVHRPGKEGMRYKEAGNFCKRLRSEPSDTN